MKRVLITGGGGYVGQHLTKKLLDRYQDIIIRTISRHEGEITRLVTLCNSDRLEPVVGDIRDADTLRYTIKDIDTTIHLAAMKHINLCEANPLEAVTINVIGCINLIQLFQGDTFIVLSTDKAIEAVSCYGATKLITESLILQKARQEKGKRFIIIRSGNVFASSGSIIERWRQLIQQDNSITVTNPQMTRFFIDIDELTDFIIRIIENGKNGEVYIPPQRVIRIGDLARAFVELYGNEATRVQITGVRKGEKMSEKLFLENEQVYTELEWDISEKGGKMSLNEIKALLAKNETRW